MAEIQLPDKAYSKLLEDLRDIRRRTEQATISVMNVAIARGYWEMGKRLSQDDLLNEKSKRTILTRLAVDLGLEYTFLTRIIKFYKLWPQQCPVDTCPNINWSHYKRLLSIHDENARTFYLIEANDNKWNTRQLVLKIKSDFYEEQKSLSEEIAQRDETITREVPMLRRRGERLYVYSAAIEKIIDGDTLMLNIDLGFDVWKRQRIRLRGIDTAELGTPEGNAAKAYVEERLRGVIRVVIQTVKMDIYGRYVCDLFYLRGETDKEKIIREGTFLNQELLDHGLANVL